MTAIMSDNENELLPIVDTVGNVIGSAVRSECHNGSMILHPVVHLHLFNSKGELFLQHRPSWKKIQPNKWDTAMGGHIGYGEDITTALERETFEELGLTGLKYKQILNYKFQSTIEAEFVYSYIAVSDAPVLPSNETNGGKFWSISEIESNLGKGVFTPNFEQEFYMLKKHGII